MSMPTLTASADDFRRWQAELNKAALEPLDGPKIPAHPTRAALQRQADAEIAEGVAEWRRTGERRN